MQRWIGLRLPMGVCAGLLLASAFAAAVAGCPGADESSGGVDSGLLGDVNASDALANDGAAPLDAADSGASAQVWRALELTFESAKDYATPYVDVLLDVTFTGPSGATVKRPAFWDGGRTWRVRFAPPSAGAWTFVTTASDPTDAGLHGRTGRVNVTPYAGALPVYARGFVKSQPGHHLVYDDGSPFWWMGYSMWGLDYGILSKSNKSDWNPPVAHPDSQILGTMDRAVDQGFNVIDFAFFNHWSLDANKKPVPDSVWTDRFQTFYDPIMAYAAERGVTVNLTVLLGEADFQTAEVLKRYARYVIARYGAYPVVFNVSEPDCTTAGCKRPPTEIAILDEAMSYAASLDAYHHPIGPWYRDTALEKQPTVYLGSWPTVIISQCGHRRALNDFSLGGRQPISTYESYYDNYPTTPMVEAGGCNYAHIFPNVTDDISRRSAWRAVQAGSSGFTYGISGIYNFMWAPNAHDAAPYDSTTPWYTAVDTPSSWQMRWLRSLYESLPWSAMAPRNTGAASLFGAVLGPPVDDISRPLARADTGVDNAVVYLPAELPDATTVELQGLASFLYEASWYDPRTGASSLIALNAIPAAGKWYVPQKPDDADWVLRLRRTATPVPPAPVPNHAPTGALESVSGGQVRGWAYDEDAPATPIEVAVYAGGAFGAGGTFVGTAMANLPRPAQGDSRGYAFRVPKAYAGAAFYVYGLDTRAGGPNALLAGSPMGP